jgi:hypothetical protein
MNRMTSGNCFTYKSYTPAITFSMLHDAVITMENPLNKEVSLLYHQFGKNKKLLKELDVLLLTALSFYPELKNTRIRFMYTKNALFPYASRPNWKTMFRRKSRWEYLILISERSIKMDAILLNKLSFKAQVGVLGHELAHTSDYITKNFWQIIFLGAVYFVPYFRKKIEHTTDKSTIVHGLGFHLYEFNSFVHSQQDFLKENKWFAKYYLSSTEILKLTKKNREQV